MKKIGGKNGIRDVKKTTMFGLFVLVFALLVFSMSYVSAYRGDYTVKGPSCDEERHEAMEDAFESLDYAVWRELMMGDGRHPRVVDVVTESNFETFVQAHEAGEAGDGEMAAQLRAELGLNNGEGPRDGVGQGRGMGRYKEQRMQQNNFVDAGCEGNCDNHVSKHRRGRLL